MNLWQRAIGHVGQAGLLFTLVIIFRRGHWRRCWTFPVYLATVLLTDTMQALWPQRFFEHNFFVLSQQLHDLLKLLVGMELAYGAVHRFPGARLVVHVVVLAGVALELVAFRAIPFWIPYRTWYEWQPQISVTLAWLFAATALLIRWYRLPVARWQRDLVLGFAVYLVVFVALLWWMSLYGNWTHTGYALAASYVLLTGWWAWISSRPADKLEEAMVRGWEVPHRP